MGNAGCEGFGLGNLLRKSECICACAIKNGSRRRARIYFRNVIEFPSEGIEGRFRPFRP